METMGRCVSIRLRHALECPIARSDKTNSAARDFGIQRLDDFTHRMPKIVAMQRIEIDLIDLKALKAFGDIGADYLRRHAVGRPPIGRAGIRQSAFRADHHLRAIPKLAQAVAQRPLAASIPVWIPRGVPVSCVEEITSRLAVNLKEVEHLPALDLRAESHYAVAQGGDGQVGIWYGMMLHVV